MKAFPCKAYLRDTSGAVIGISDYPGMDLRDYFAAKALQGMLGNPTSDDYEDEVLRRENYKEYCKSFAESAYEVADAMMEARGNREGEKWD